MNFPIRRALSSDLEGIFPLHRMLINFHFEHFNQLSEEKKIPSFIKLPDAEEEKSFLGKQLAVVDKSFSKLPETGFENGDFFCFVATHEEKIVGFLVSQFLSSIFFEDRAHWFSSAVDPDYRGKGIARSLVTESKSFYEGVQLFSGTIYPFNELSQRTFASEGEIFMSTWVTQR